MAQLPTLDIAGELNVQAEVTDSLSVELQQSVQNSNVVALPSDAQEMPVDVTEASAIFDSVAIESGFNNMDESLWGAAAVDPPPAASAPLVEEAEQEEELFTAEELFNLPPEVLEKDAAHHEVCDPKLFDAHNNTVEAFGDEDGDVSLEMMLQLAAGLPQQEYAASLLKTRSALDAAQQKIVSERKALRAVAMEGFGDEEEINQRREAADAQGISSLKFLYSTVPELPKLPEGDCLWLLDMPKIDPNRQVLHVEPQPFTDATTPKHSDDRRLYTPHNVIRWTYGKTSKVAISNARIVHWSDGTTSLRVGKDYYEALPSQDPNLHLLTAPVELAGNWSCTGQTLPALVSVVHPDEHRVLKLHSSRSTVDYTLVNETRLERAHPSMERLAFPTRVLPEFGDRKHPNMSTEEEFAARKREERKREMRTKSLTFTDQLGMEAELFRALHSATAGQLADDLDQQILEQRSNTGTETGNRSVTGRSATRRSQDLARSFSNVAAAPAPPLTDQPRKRMRNGGEENGSPNGVVSAALKEYARQIPEDNTAGRGILNALLEMIDRRLVSDEALSREVPRALQELRTEHPGLANIPYRAVLDAVGFTGEI